MFDLHVHAEPDITTRRFDDHDTIRTYESAGFSGCVLKGHYESTTGRAAIAGKGSTVNVYGGLALNQHVGGLNVAAVAAALATGARVVWMPTADAHTQRAAGLPRLSDTYPELGATTYAIPPVDWRPADTVSRICALVADADAVLATGHLSTAEVAWLLPVARHHGVRRLLLTHPGYTVPGMTSAEAAELAGTTAYAEVTAYQLFAQPDCDAARLAALIRAVGPERTVLSSDVGQPHSPTAPEALEYMIDVLAAEGLDRQELRAAASEQPERLVTP